MQPEHPRHEFVWNSHEYVNEFIRFADTKAQLLVAWTSALLGVLLASNFHHYFTSIAGCLRNASWAQRVQGGLAFLAFLFLVMGFAFAITVVFPRLKSTQATGMIFWDGVRSKKRDEFVDLVLKVYEYSLTKQVAEHLYDLGGVAQRKYWWLKLAIPFAVIGSVLGGLVVLIYG